MVLKNILFIFISFVFAVSAMAENRNVHIHVALAFKKKEYKKAIDLVYRMHDIYSKETDREVYTILAYSYKALKQHQRVIKTSKLFIELNLKKEHDNFMAFYNVSGTDDVEEGPKNSLAEFYFLMGEAYYLDSLEAYGSEGKKGFYRFYPYALRYSELTAESDSEFAKKADKIISKLEKFKKRVDNIRYSKQASLHVGYLFWNDRIKVKLSNEVKDTRSNASALSFAYDLSYRRYDSILKVQAAYVIGSASIGNNATIGFFKSATPVYGYMLKPSVHFMSPFKNASFGLSMPYFYRVIELEDIQNAKVSPLEQLTYGMALENHWFFDDNSYLNVSYGKMAHFESLFLTIGYGYVY